MSDIVYARQPDLSVDDYISVVGDSALGPTRPLGDRPRVEAMLRGASLLISARVDGRCVGLARCLTDFAWVAYLADLAVAESQQGKGIGKGLVLKLRQELGDGVGIALFSLPEAAPFYDRVGSTIGLHRYADAYWMSRKRGV